MARLDIEHAHASRWSGIRALCAMMVMVTYVLGRLLVIDSLAIEEEPPSREIDGALLAVRIENLSATMPYTHRHTDAHTDVLSLS